MSSWRSSSTAAACASGPWRASEASLRLRRGGGPRRRVGARRSPARGEGAGLAAGRRRHWLLGTRRRLVVVAADDSTDLAVGGRSRTLPGTATRAAAHHRGRDYGEPRPSYTFQMGDPALLLQLIRERVIASMVLQRRVPVRDELGVTVIGRRSPVGGPVAWMHAYDAGLDPADPTCAQWPTRRSPRKARSARRRPGGLLGPQPDLARASQALLICGRDPL